MIYYISDVHFQDQRVFDKCKKPFKDLNDYQEEIIKRWNAKVQTDDIVYVLGDVADEAYHEVVDVIKQLNGIKHLIVGNHDENNLDYYKKSGCFSSVKFIDVILDKNRKVCICHYPLMDWMEFSRGGYHVYGHIHNKSKANDEAYVQIKKYHSNKPCYNASVDVTNYEPVTLDEMITLKEANKNEAYIN